jgi:hypothetical protein
MLLSPATSPLHEAEPGAAAHNRALALGKGWIVVERPLDDQDG